MQSNESNFKVNPTSLHPDERQKWLQALAVNMVALNKYLEAQAKVNIVQPQVKDDNVHSKHEHSQAMHEHVQVHQEKDREKILIRHEQALSLKFRITDASKGFYEYESLGEEEKEALPRTTLEVMRDVANMVEGPRK
jgi:hypothetical protein